MIRRVILEEWQMISTLIIFFVTLFAFVYFTVRALRMRKQDRERISQLPLEDDLNERKPRDE
jgi:cbb3-type cytochrome oxidase subunit 3